MGKIEEIKKAILRGDEFYEGIKLPKGQIGTLFQQESYARMKAKELYETHFKNVSTPQVELSLSQKLATIDLTQMDVAILHVLLILKEHYWSKKQQKNKTSTPKNKGK